MIGSVKSEAAPGAVLGAPRNAPEGPGGSVALPGLYKRQLSAINPRLIPLIIHDRAGFEGGLFTRGLLVAPWE